MFFDEINGKSVYTDEFYYDEIDGNSTDTDIDEPDSDQIDETFLDEIEGNSADTDIDEPDSDQMMKLTIQSIYHFECWILFWFDDDFLRAFWWVFCCSIWTSK